MSPRDRFSGFKSGPKKPPPADGIRIKKSGTTWWGQRWISALEQILRGDAGRLARGRTYARAGRTHDLQIEDGKVSAKVTGSRSAPYEISIALSRLSDEIWSQAIVTMANKAQFAAELLSSEMPKEIDEVFHSLGASLFPKKRSELVTDCNCPDWGDPCKHVAATHYVLGEALDRDPFLLFELRGRTKAQVLEALRTARGKAIEEGPTTLDAPATISSVSLENVEAQDYDKPRDKLPALHLSFSAPPAHGSLLRQLGTPTTWHGATPPADALTPLLQAAAERARQIALADPAPNPAPTPTPAATKSKKRPGR